MIKRLPAVAALLLAVSCLVFGSPAVHAQNAHKTTFTASLTPPTARPGETVTLTITATVEAPFHIYSVVPAVVPPTSTRPQPTEFTIEAKGLSPVGTFTESAPHISYDKQFKTDVGQHEGTVAFTQLLKVEPDATGNLPIKASVRFMACNASSCLPPKSLDLTVPAVTVEAGAPRPEYVGLQPKSVAASGAAPVENSAPVVSGSPVLPAQTARKTTFTTALTPSAARIGETVTLTVTAKVESPFHIYSIVPTKGSGPQPTEFTVEAKGLSSGGRRHGKRAACCPRQKFQYGSGAA